jgi:glyoxylase-like metal-dependent hydrolase (beta-lactamase superfamily II)
MNVSYLDFGRNIEPVFGPLADGVFQIKGTSHNSVLIELQDYLVVVEAPLYEERSEKVLAAIAERYPTKAVRYVIPTHFHNDHSGGMRTYMVAGISVIAPAISAAHYERIGSAPNTIRVEGSNQIESGVHVEGITGPKILEDDTRRIEIYPHATAHSDDYLIVYLPHEKFVIEADHVSPRIGGSVRPGELPRQFLEGIEELQLDVQTIIGIHGDVASFDELISAVRGSAR